MNWKKFGICYVPYLIGVFGWGALNGGLPSWGAIAAANGVFLLAYFIDWGRYEP